MLQEKEAVTEPICEEGIDDSSFCKEFGDEMNNYMPCEVTSGKGMPLMNENVPFNAALTEKEN
jgi:hypothetical protein